MVKTTDGVEVGETQRGSGIVLTEVIGRGRWDGVGGGGGRGPVR